MKKKSLRALQKEIGGYRYKIGNDIHVTENDIIKFRRAIEKLVNNLETELKAKYRKKLTPTKAHRQ